MNSSSTNKLPGFGRLSAGLFLLSAGVLFHELLCMRLLSFMLWHHLAYMVLSVAMLGFGASGAWLACRKKSYNPGRMIVVCAIISAAANIIGFAVISRLQLDTFELGPLKLLKLGFYYGMLLAPYFFAGAAVAVVFRHAVTRVTALYCVNLVGSGVGCYLFMILLGPLGGPAALTLVSVMGLMAALIWSVGSSSRLTALAAVCLVAAVALIPASGTLYPMKAAPTKSLARHLELDGARIELTQWTPLARIDVLGAPMMPHPFLKQKVPGYTTRTITIDGDANTWMFRRPALGDPYYDEYFSILKKNAYALAFHLKKNPKVLIIGAGGGNEVAIAKHMQAASVTGVELNPAILEQSVFRYADFVGNLYQSPNINPEVGEGRSFVRRSSEKYDIIQMSGVDTWSGLSSGAYVLSENYLYTVDAAREFIEHLTPDGILSIGRFLMSPPRESLRIVSNVLRALEETGAENPEDHLAVVSYRTKGFARVLVKRSAYTPEEIRIISGMVTEKERKKDSTIWYAPHMDGGLKTNTFLKFVTAVSSGPDAAEKFYRTYPYNIRPVYDDKPFFFEYYKWRYLFHDLTHGGRGGQIGANRPVGVSILMSLLFQVLVLCLIFIFVPLSRLGGLNMRGAWPLAGGFGALGAAFMFVEVGLMQKLVLFLGHPTYSISVTLFSILVFSGLGSLVAGSLKFDPGRRLLISVCAICFFLILYALFLDHVQKSLLGFSMGYRIVIAGSIVALPAFFMGMPFPLGLKSAAGLSDRAVPYAWGINGGASVLGSILVIVLAMSLGFRMVLAVSALLYVAAFLCLRSMARASEGCRIP